MMQCELVSKDTTQPTITPLKMSVLLHRNPPAPAQSPRAQAVELPAGVEMVMPGDNLNFVATLIAPIAMGGRREHSEDASISTASS